MKELPDQRHRIEVYLDEEMRRQHLPGVSLAVVRDGRLDIALGRGLANVEWDAPATEDTVYELASLTKPFTATALMLLAEAGAVTVDDRLKSYFPDAPLAWDSVTLRHLLTHTSGIPNYMALEPFRAHDAFRWREDVTQDDFLRAVYAAPLDFTPGSRAQYSNTGYYLLGMLIERLSGKSYEQFLTDRIFGPIGMRATRRNSRLDLIPQRASGYGWEQGALRNAEYTSVTWAYAEGGIVSSAADLARWDAALTAGIALPQARLEQMWEPERTGNEQSDDFGLGWVIEERRGQKVVMHDGGKPGFSTVHMRFLAGAVSVILLVNRDGVRTIRDMAETVAGFYLPGE